jgi:Helicase conserved C-terminal domain
MSADYQAFLAGKAPRATAVGIEPAPMPGHLLDFAAYCTEFCIRQGRAALFLDTGMTKTRCQLEFSKQAAAATNGYALILTPLAVTRQFEREGLACGYDVRVVRDRSEVRPGINVCNYDRLDKLECSIFGSVSLDESSVLKSFTGATTRALIQAFAATRFRLCATATPAPNDHMELGQHAEFLGIMPSNEMLARWFISDQTEMGRYRLKKFGENDFWDWMSSWARMASNPADLGFDGSRFILPELKIVRHRAIGEVRPEVGSLFMSDVSATNIFAVKRQTSEARAALAFEIWESGNDDPWIVWCDTNSEQDQLDALFGDSMISIRGSMPPEEKESRLYRWMNGNVPVLGSKSSIFGYGMNFQRCPNMIFVGRSFSYESWYQAVRRCWRFGQTKPVHVHIIVAEGEDQIGRVVDRKAADHATMKTAMADAMRRDLAKTSQLSKPYNPTFSGRTPAWLQSIA